MKNRFNILKKLTKIKKEKHHPLIHKIHKKYGISRKTIFYMKEYGPHTNIAKTIIKESIKVLLLASILSSIGGLAMEEIKKTFIMFIPLIILLPTLNDTIGNYGTIISSRFSTMLHEGIVGKKWWANKHIIKLFVQILLIAVSISLISALAALTISMFSGYALQMNIAYKIVLINLIDTFLLVNIVFFIAIFAGLRIYKKKEDPSNFLIPITTSIADLGNMVILATLIMLIL